VVSLKYGGAVFRDGVKVGGVGRRVTRSGPGNFRVEHLNLTISMVEARKKGFAEQYWADALKRYPSFGIDQITILADDDGRCFWARDPVQFEDAELARIRLAAWPSPDGGATPAGSAAFAHDAVASGLAQQSVTAVIKDIEDLNRNLSPADLYAHQDGPGPAGSRFVARCRRPVSRIQRRGASLVVAPRKLSFRHLKRLMIRAHRRRSRRTDDQRLRR